MLARSHLIFVVITMLFGAGVTLWGLSQMHWPTASSFNWSTKFLYIGYFVMGGVIITGIARLAEVGHLTAGALTLGLISILTGTIWPLIVSLWFVCASFILGLTILSILKIDKGNTSGLTAFLIGAGAYGTAVGLLAHFPINYPGVYGVALALPIIFGWRLILKEVQTHSELKLQSAEFRWLDLAICLIVFVHFAVALMPEVGHDALAMHLFIPGHLFNRHEWGFDVNTYVWAVMPLMGDWIYSIVYMLGGESAARLINVCFIFVLSILLRNLVIWAGGNERGARWAVVIFLTTPLVYLESSSLFIESIWASFIVAGTLSIFKTLSQEDSPNLHIPVAGFLLGSALATKAVTLSILPVLLIFLIIRYKVWVKVNLTRSITLGILLFLAVGIIPYFTAWHITGNPVFPFFNEYFNAPQYSSENFSSSFFEKGVSWDTIYRITFESGRYLEGKPGAAGFQWLLLLVPTIVLFISTLNRKGMAIIIVGILAVVFTFYQTAYLRYVFPSYVILSAGIGVALSEMFSEKRIWVRRLVIIVCLLGVFLNLVFFKSGTHYGNIAIKPLLSETGRHQYLQRRLPIRNAVKLVNELNINKTPVAVFGPPLTAGLFSDALYSSWYNHKFQSLIQGANDANAIADVLLNKGVEYIILDRSRVKLEKRSMIEKSTRVVADFGAITVRSLKEEYRFNTELLKDPDFSMPSTWSFSKTKENKNGGVIVSNKSAGTQVVPVISGRTYLLTVKASCLSGDSKGRLQVNWLNAKSKFVSTSIRVFDCTQNSEFHSMEVVAPDEALKAVIYATGHTIKPLIINRISFKK